MLKRVTKKTFIIAEIGINHGGNINKAYKLIDAAKKSGADAVKFQTYITEKRASKKSPIFEILKTCELSFEEFFKINKYCKEKNILFFSTPFDIESCKFLIKDLRSNLLKIASFDSSNLDLISEIKKYKTNVIMSIGLSNIKEIQISARQLSKTNNLALLHCVTSYPNKDSDANISVINNLKKLFPKNIIGYSDHTKGIYVPCLAVAAGAKIIEKHFMINKRDNVVDKSVSIDSQNFKKMVSEIRKIENILGDNKIKVRDVEKKFLIFKRKKIIS